MTLAAVNIALDLRERTGVDIITDYELEGGLQMARPKGCDGKSKIRSGGKGRGLGRGRGKGPLGTPFKSK